MNSCNPIVLFRQWQTWRERRRNRARLFALLAESENHVQHTLNRMAEAYHLACVMANENSRKEAPQEASE